MDPVPTETGVAVAGGGMAGLVAGARAVELGAMVDIFEKGTSLGGSMAMSGGTIWTYDAVETATTVASRGDPLVQSLVVDRYEESIAWLEGLDVALTEWPEPTDRTVMEADTAQLTRTLVDVIEDGGGVIHLETPMERLRTEGGVVTGLETVTDTERPSVDADAVVLATGGLQGNEELIERHVTDRTDRLWLRSNPWSTGDGFLAAREAGAKTTTGSGWFYGHNMAAPPATFPPESFVDVTQYYGPSAIAVDEHGHRFIDEPACDGEEELAVATAKLADGRAYYVLDAELAASHHQSSSRIETMVDNAEAAGGRVARAASLEGLARAVADWRLDGEELVETLREFNAVIEDGGRLDPLRSGRRQPVDKPPFHVVAVQPGITFSTGGLAVREDMSVLARSRSSSLLPQHPDGDVRLEPLGDLFAAGADVGNVHNGGYIGGLATALVTGLTAAESAADCAGS